MATSVQQIVFFRCPDQLKSGWHQSQTICFSIFIDIETNGQWYPPSPKKLSLKKRVLFRDGHPHPIFGLSFLMTRLINRCVDSSRIVWRSNSNFFFETKFTTIIIIEFELANNNDMMNRSILVLIVYNYHPFINIFYYYIWISVKKMAN